MCGIVGFQNFKKVNFDCIKKLKQITQILNHRGPDYCGYWKCDNRKTFLGHTRLSIIDLSDKASQPMISLSNEIIITFNGEISDFIG